MTIIHIAVNIGCINVVPFSSSRINLFRWYFIIIRGSYNALACCDTLFLNFFILMDRWIPLFKTSGNLETERIFRGFLNGVSVSLYECNFLALVSGSEIICWLYQKKPRCYCWHVHPTQKPRTLTSTLTRAPTRKFAEKAAQQRRYDGRRKVKMKMQ